MSRNAKKKMSSPDGSPPIPNNIVPQTELAPILSINVDPPPTSKPQGKSFVASQTVMERFSGPMPPPEYLARYEQICPGSADRMLAMAEKEAGHRRTTETTIVSAQINHHHKQFSEARLGQICALIITLAALGAGVYTASQGHEVTGSILGVGGIGGIVLTFILGRTKQETEEEPEPPTKSTPKSNRRKNRRG